MAAGLCGTYAKAGGRDRELGCQAARSCSTPSSTASRVSPTLEAARENMRGAIELHLTGLREDGLRVLEGRGADETEAEIVEVA